MPYEKEYLEIGGGYYVVDLESLSKFVGLTIETTEQGEDEKTYEKQIDVSRYEMVKFMLEVIFTDNEEIDNKLGISGLHSLSTPFKLAFNSLLHHNILKEV